MNYVQTLLYGLDFVPKRGSPGSVQVTGDRSFCVVKSNRNQLCLMAATEYGQGRIVAISHNGYIGDLASVDPNFSQDRNKMNIAILDRNIIRWLSHSDDQSQPTAKNILSSYTTSGITLGGLGINSEYLQRFADKLTMTDSSFTCRVATAATTSSTYDINNVIAANPDVIIWTNNALKEEIIADPVYLDQRAATLLHYVYQGGAIYVAVCPWGWAQLAKVSVEQMSLFNQVLTMTGLTLAGDGAQPDRDDGWYTQDSIQDTKNPSSQQKVLDVLKAIDRNEKVTNDQLTFAQLFITWVPAHVLSGRAQFANADPMLLPDSHNNLRDIVQRYESIALNRGKICLAFPFDGSISNNRLTPDQASAALFISWLHTKSGVTPVSLIPPLFLAHVPAFPGRVIASGQPSEPFLIAINPLLSGLQSTAIYAPPAEILELTISDQVLMAYPGITFEVRIGCHQDKLRTTSEGKYRLARHTDIVLSRVWAPSMMGRDENSSFSWREAPCRTATMLVSTVYGGPLYILIKSGITDEQKKRTINLEPIAIRVIGGVRMPYFTVRNSFSQFDNYPSHLPWKDLVHLFSQAPWGEVEGRYLIFTAPTSALAKMDRLQEAIDFWDNVLEHELALAGDTLDKKERIVSDKQISAGYMHSGYPIMTHMDIWDVSDNGKPKIFDMETLLRSPTWGLYHELGHNRQKWQWTWNGLTEVTVNIFSLYATQMMNGLNPYRSEYYTRNCKKLAIAFLQNPSRSYSQFENDYNIALSSYVILIEEFGWPWMSNVFRYYKEHDVKPNGNQEKITQWVLISSKMARMDLRPYYDAWRFPYDNNALVELSQYAKWTKDILQLVLTN